MGMLRNLVGAKNVDGAAAAADGAEKAFHDARVKLDEAEAKIVPFIKKVQPALGPVLTRLIESCPELQALDLGDEVALFVEGVQAIPGALDAAEAALDLASKKAAEVEAQIKSL